MEAILEKIHFSSCIRASLRAGAKRAARVPRSISPRDITLESNQCRTHFGSHDQYLQAYLKSTA